MPKLIFDARTQNRALLTRDFDAMVAGDATTGAALEAGDRAAHVPEDHGYIRSRAVEDLDGHRWAPFAMDMEAAAEATGHPKAAAV